MSDFQLGEFHAFEAAGRRFLYLVPSGAIFEPSPLACEILDGLAGGIQPPADAEEAVQELLQVRAVTAGDRFHDPVEKAPLPFPLSTLVLNVTNQCNLSCKYCYEFGEDRVANPEGKPEYMPEETAHAAVDYLLANSPGRRAVHVTFFGGETLLNFKVVCSTIEYARARAREAGKYIDFSLTTNATLLSAPVIDFLAEHRVGITISIDGPRELHDQFRVFQTGRGSYDVIVPKIRALLEKHRTRPIGARVTLTSQVVDVLSIYRHLKNDLGFHEVGFAPVTTAPVRLYSIGGGGLDVILAQFRTLAREYLEHALRGEHHGFSNVTDTLAELHQGISKAHPCGAGLGLLGVGPSGDLAPCHRFVDSDRHRLGHISTGIDPSLQARFLDQGHISQKTDCHTCWARPVCSGGCYHEAYVRYGSTGHPNLHYCDWIRSWTHTCLQIYGEIATRNPGFLRHYEERSLAA